jgi:hypothetical protein
MNCNECIYYSWAVNEFPCSDCSGCSLFVPDADSANLRLLTSLLKEVRELKTIVTKLIEEK